MTFQVNDRVVHSTYGIGRVVGLVTKRFTTAEPQRYYEVAIERNTVWVPADAAATPELRLLTSKAELARGRAILQSRPVPMTPDHRQRRLELTNRLRNCSFQALCELVRDLNARGWHKPLNEVDSAGLRKARQALCQEWAATDEIALSAATEEIDGLLLAGRQRYRV